MDEQPYLPLPDLPGVGDGWELLLPREERARRCTGQSAVKTEELRRAIVEATVQLGTRQVANAFKVSREVVRALRSEAVRSGELDHLRKEFGMRALALADKIVDRIDDEIDEMPRTALPVAYGILTDKGLLHAGQPTGRIEHVKAVTHEDINEWINSLPTAEPVYSGGNSPQKDFDPGKVSGAIEAGADTAREVDKSGSSDSQSPVSNPSPYVIPEERADSGRIDPQKEGTR